MAGHSCFLKPGHAFAIGGIIVRAAIVQPSIDLIAIQNLHQAGDVVGIGVGHDQQVERAVPEGHLLAQGRGQVAGAGAAVDQDLLPAGRGDEHRVALAHVEKGDVQLAVRQLQDGKPGQDGYDCRPAEEEKVDLRAVNELQTRPTASRRRLHAQRASRREM